MNKKTTFAPKDIEKLYKEQAKTYVKFADNSFSWNYLEKPLLEKVLSMNLPKNPTILDAGCGNGRLIKYLVNKKYRAKNIIGIDISEEMLNLARKNVPEVKFLKMDLTKVNLPNKFDLVICSHVLHYLDEKDFKKVLKNFYKLLNDQGILLFVITHPVRTTRKNLEDYFKRDWIIDHTPWKTESPLFIRPVADMVNSAIGTGFTIKALEEPQVSIKAKKVDPVNFAKYSNCPSRVGVIAVK